MSDDVSIDILRKLIELERKMDAGEQPFVVYKGDRAAFDGAVLDYFGATSGQTVSHTLLIAMMTHRHEQDALEYSAEVLAGPHVSNLSIH